MVQGRHQIPVGLKAILQHVTKNAEVDILLGAPKPNCIIQKSRFINDYGYVWITLMDMPTLVVDLSMTWTLNY